MTATRSGLIVIVLLSLAASAAALQPDEVVVIVNRSIDESVALGRFYCDKRGVPLDNLIALDLPKTDTISMADYDRLLSDPLREALDQRGLTERVQCLLTVRGVPFRLEPGEPPAEITRMLEWCSTAAERARRRLAGNVMMMSIVGSHFPASASPEVDPMDLVALFGGLPDIPDEVPSVEVMRTQFSQLAQEKAGALAEMSDATRRAVAARQIVGLYLDTFGLISWESAARLVGEHGPPVPADYLRYVVQAQREVAGLMQVKRPDEGVFARLERRLRLSEGAIGLFDAVASLVSSMANRTATDSRAAVDNELALVLWSEYPREGWLDNPLLWLNDSRRAAIERDFGRTVMTSRIDGPTVASVMRIVLNSIAAERDSLAGTLYVDAGMPSKNRQFEMSLVDLAVGTERKTDIPVVLERTVASFGRGACPNAALYAGWYSPGRYIPSFTWRPGAVGYHLAELEAQELRDPDSQQWVPRMIAEGVAATVGAVEPTAITALPAPAWLMGLLMSGEVTVCEAYWRTLPNVSWRVMLIADPLYAPFRAAPNDVGLPRSMFPPTARDR